MMNKNRKQIYDELELRIGNTPLVLYQGDVKHNNLILIKRECDNPFGSHYDRVFFALFKHYESIGRIKPGDKVLETSSGSAGISFAGVGNELGYDCFVAMPAGGEKAREKAVVKFIKDRTRLILTPEEKYISAFTPRTIAKLMVTNGIDLFMNHSAGQNGTCNEITLKALEEIANEVNAKAVVDFHVGVVGNGSSLLGVARALPKSTEIYALEHVKSQVLKSLLFGGDYFKADGSFPGIYGSRHLLPGMSYQGVVAPHIAKLAEGEFIDYSDVCIITDRHTDMECRKLREKYKEEYPMLSDSRNAFHWDIDIPYASEFGRTTKACLAKALELTSQGRSNLRKSDTFVIAYDKADRYDDSKIFDGGKIE